MTTTYAEFGAQTTATEVAKAFSARIRGKTFVVTGTSPGSLGQALALSLSSQTPHLLILASRTPAKLHAVVSLIHATYPSPALNVKAVLLDLASQRSIREAATQIQTLVGKGNIDVLFNNAGINVKSRQLTPEGLELQFATNHVGPFLFTKLLLPLLLRGGGVGTGKSRVVITSSEAHRISPVRFSDYNQEPGRHVDRDEEPRRGLPQGLLRGGGRYEPLVAYGMSKTANVLMAVGLNSRYGVEVEGFAVMPGTIMTELVRDLDEKSLNGLTAGTEVWKNIDEGSATMLVAALDPLLNTKRGVYLDDCQLRRPSKWASDPKKAERLWKLTETLVGERSLSGQESKL